MDSISPVSLPDFDTDLLLVGMDVLTAVIENMHIPVPAGDFTSALPEHERSGRRSSPSKFQPVCAVQLFGSLNPRFS